MGAGIHQIISLAEGATERPLPFEYWGPRRVGVQTTSTPVEWDGMDTPLYGGGDIYERQKNRSGQ